MKISSFAAAIALGVAIGIAAPGGAVQAQTAAAKPKPPKFECEKDRKACEGKKPTREKKEECKEEFKECKLEEHCAKHPKDKKKCPPPSA